MGSVGWVRSVLEPWLTFLRALPPLAYFFLLVIWLGIDEAPKITLLALAALPGIAHRRADPQAGAGGTGFAGGFAANGHRPRRTPPVPRVHPAGGGRPRGEGGCGLARHSERPRRGGGVSCC